MSRQSRQQAHVLLRRASKLTLEYRLLDTYNGAKQHARYLLGTGCGLQFDHGFDAASDTSLNHVHWLSATEVRPLLKKFNLPDA